MKNVIKFALLISLTSLTSTAQAQSAPTITNALGTVQSTSPTSTADTARSTSHVDTNPLAQLTKANRDYKANSQGVIHLQEQEIAKAAAEVEQMRQLVSEGLLARNELAACEAKLIELRASLEATKQSILDSERLIAELKKADVIAKTQATAAAKSRSLVKPTILRYNGSADWALSKLSSVQQFFSATFGRVLPTSAVGQSATHNRLGWNHRNAVDIPVHPDSAEGKALIGYLRTNKIPFLAFRGAIRGVSTGPHIHIGLPSQRV